MNNLPDAVISYLQYESLVGATQKKFTSLASRSTINNLLILQNLFLNLNPSYTLEIGMAHGFSSLLFTDLHYHRNSLNLPDLSRQQHCVIDPFQEQVWDSTGLMIIEKFGYQELLEFYQDFSSLVLPRLVADNKKYGLIYVDGSHLFEDVFIDFYYCFHLLDQDGVVVFDDCSDPHILKVIKFIRRNFGDQLEEINLLPFRDNSSSLLSYAKYKLGTFLGKTQACAFKKVKPSSRPWDAKLYHF